MKAQELKYAFDTFKHEFKKTNGVYTFGYMHKTQGSQSFRLMVDPKDGTEIMTINNSPCDRNAITFHTTPRIFELNDSLGKLGRSKYEYHWVEYAVRTGRFTYFIEQNTEMKRQIRALMIRFGMVVDRFSMDDSIVLYIHPALVCGSCHGVKTKRIKPDPKTPSLIEDPTCIRCSGTLIDPNVDIKQLGGPWENFEG